LTNREGKDWMRILLAVDGSAYSDEATKEVASRPWPAGSEVRIISVVEPPAPPPPDVLTVGVDPDFLVESLEWQRRHARETVEEAARTLKSGVEKTLKVATDVLTGSPREFILLESEVWAADLIVVGSHGYGFWERVVLGSVSQAVASHAKCSVEIVRRRKAEESSK
jgi:nucleotide-binding universal stress UspA family protein